MVKIQYKEQFEKLAREYIKRDGIEQLLEHLAKSDFYTAPASTRFHDSEPEGLVKHSINVFNYLFNDYDSQKQNLNTESIAICALFHDLCKIGFYVSEVKNRKVYKPNGTKVDSMGRYDWESYTGYTVDDKFPIGHGEKSVIMLREFMKLTADEMLAIRWHMGQYDDSAKGGSYSVNNAYEMCPLAVLLNIADIKATYLTR